MPTDPDPQRPRLRRQHHGARDRLRAKQGAGPGRHRQAQPDSQEIPVISKRTLAKDVSHGLAGDLPNARYWYARCGRRLRKGIAPEAELREIEKALGA